MEIDDGTGSISCQTPMAMMERITGLRVGHTVDCIGEPQTIIANKEDNDMTVIGQGNTVESNQEKQEENTATVRILVETLLEVRQNPASAERLRWLEIMTTQQASQSITTTSSQQHALRHPIAWCGYPSLEVTSGLLYDIIESTHQHDQETATIANLVVVLETEASRLQPLLEELQLDGLIYENEKGSFVPL